MHELSSQLAHANSVVSFHDAQKVSSNQKLNEANNKIDSISREVLASVFCVKTLLILLIYFSWDLCEKS